MAAEQSDAIILRSFPWSETSLVANIYTRDFGKLSVLAKGARRPKSPFEAALDLLSLCRVVFIPKSGDALDLLTEAKLQRRFRAGSHDLLRLYAGYYVAELLERLTDKGQPQPEVFEVAVATLQALAQPELEVRGIVLNFEIQMLRYGGQLPSWTRCVHCGRDVPDSRWFLFDLVAGGVLCEACQPTARHTVRMPADTRRVLQYFSQPTWRQIDLSRYPHEHRAAIRTVIGRYLTFVLDRQPNLHSYLEELGR